jgi:hypothetical protein
VPNAAAKPSVPGVVGQFNPSNRRQPVMINWGTVPGELSDDCADDPDAIDNGITEAMDEVAREVYGGMVLASILVIASILLLVALLLLVGGTGMAVMS